MGTLETAQLLQFVAAARVVQPKHLLRLLILRLMATNDALTVDDVRSGLRNSFAFEAPTEEVSAVLHELHRDRFVVAIGNRYRIENERAPRFRTPIEDAQELEKSVKEHWLGQVADEWPSLPPEALWAALRRYLSAAFSRHGVQAATFLFPSVEILDEADLSRSLTQLLDGAVAELGPDADTGRTAITRFLTQAPDDKIRRQYLQQLADGAVLFYMYKAPPGSAELIRKKLEAITLVLDTNFLFGILDLHANPYVAASRELMRIRDEGLPLTLVYHPATLHEMKESIAFWATELKKGEPYPRHLSRASLESPFVSGIVRKYHEVNANVPTPVTEFLRRFANIELLLSIHKIGVWDAPPSSSRQPTLLAEYTEYLKEQAERRKQEGRPKMPRRPPKAQTHDMTILDAVISARTEGPSDLSALLLLTCDYHLFAFDNLSARRHRRTACSVLPNMLWQAFRSCVEPSQNFERSFASVFALPEFRTISSSASETSVRVLAYLAALYRDLHADVAARLLSSTALMERLRDEPDEELRAEIEKAVADEEQSLLEDRTAALEAERREADSLRETVEQLQGKLAQLETAHAHRGQPDSNRDTERPRPQDEDGVRLLAAVVIFLVVACAAGAAVPQVARWIDWQWFLELRMVNQIVALFSMLLGTICAIAFLPSRRRHGLVIALVFGLLFAFVSWFFSVLPVQQPVDEKLPRGRPPSSTSG